MWALSCLCVLLPLAAASQTCNSSVAKSFITDPNRNEEVLETLANNKWWFIASSCDFENKTLRSVELTYGSYSSNTVTGTIVWRYSKGKTDRSGESKLVLDKDHVVSSGKHNLYFIKCSENLIAAYRCQISGSDNDGSMFYIWAPYSKTAAELSDELKTCEADIQKRYSSACFNTLYHP